MNTQISQTYQKRFVTVLAAVLLLALIPLYLLAFYAHPSVDDYYYGAETAALWRESGDAGAVIRLSFDMMKESYETWQGNFAAIFLMRLQPGIFGENAYFIAPLILITSFAAATLSCFYLAARRLLKAGKAAALAAAVAVSFCALEFCYRPVDSFYWYNGGIYYTFFFSLSLFLYALLIQAGSGKTRAGRIVAAAAAVPLAFLIGGGNYSTALSCAVLLASVCVFLFVTRRKTGAWLPTALALAALLVSLAVSILAPGNAVRQSVTGESSGVVKALVYSFAYGGYSLAEGLKVPVLVLWIGLLPLLYRLTGRTNFQYRCPLLVLLFTFGIYSSQGTALFYAQGLRMPERMSNIIYFNAYLFTAFNLAYFCGWLRRRCPGNALEKLGDKLFASEKYLTRFALALAILFALGCIGLCRVSEGSDGGAAFDLEPLSVNAAYSLASGEAARFDAEMQARADFLSAQDEGAFVILKPLSASPKALVHSDITGDPEDFKNDHLARFYYLGGVVVGTVEEE